MINLHWTRIYIIHIQRFTSVHLNTTNYLIYINLYNLHLYLLIHLLYFLYNASIRHAGISATEKQYYYYYQWRIWGRANEAISPELP